MQVNRGLFITFEGGDGSGKSEQVKRLVRELHNYDEIGFYCYREPGGTDIGDIMREALLHPLTDEPIPAQSEFLHFVGSRAPLVFHKIEPNLKKGKLVLVDRYTDSSEAYQGYGRGLDPAYIRKVNRIATGGLVPNLTLLYDLDPEVALGRVGERKDRIEGEGLDFHRRVREGYLTLARENERFVVIDASQSIEEVWTETRRIVFEKIRGWGNWTFDS